MGLAGVFSLVGTLRGAGAKAELLQGQAKKFISGFNAEHLNLGQNAGEEKKQIARW